MTTVWSVFITFCEYLPWVAVALMASLALRRGYSTGLLMQAFGAAAEFLVAMLAWVVNWLLQWMRAPYNAVNACRIIMAFLLFAALVIFAVGYCLERFKRKGGAGFPVVARPVP